MKYPIDKNVYKDKGYHVSFGEYPFRIDLHVQYIGQDLLVSIAGGTKPHIGAVSLSQYHPSMSDPAKPSASTSLMVLAPHKEGQVVYDVGNLLAREFQSNVVVTGGIHIDNATAEDIQQLVDNMYKAIAIVKSRLHCTQ